jgi:hypothetical protein
MWVSLLEGTEDSVCYRENKVEPSSRGSQGSQTSWSHGPTLRVSVACAVRPARSSPPSPARRCHRAATPPHDESSRLDFHPNRHRATPLTTKAVPGFLRRRHHRARSKLLVARWVRCWGRHRTRQRIKFNLQLVSTSAINGDDSQRLNAPHLDQIVLRTFGARLGRT